MTYKIRGDAQVENALSARSVNRIPAEFVHVTGVTITPDPTRYDNNTIAVSNSSTGNITIGTAGSPLLWQEVAFELTNTDAITRNFVFGTAYKAADGVTDLGTLNLATLASRNLRFVANASAGATAWVLASDSDGLSAGGGTFNVTSDALHYAYRSRAATSTSGFLNLGTGNNGTAWRTLAAAGQRLNLTSTDGLIDQSSFGLTVSATQYTIVRAGRYEFKCDAQPAADNANSTGWFQLVKNGATILAVGSSFTASLTTQSEFAMHWYGSLIIGDTIDIRFGTNVAANALFGKVQHSLIEQTTYGVIP